MSLSDKMNAIYKQQQTTQRDPDEFKKVAEIMFGYVSENLIKKVEKKSIDTTGLFGGGRPYVRTDIYITTNPAFPKDHIQIDNRNTVIVNSFRKEGKRFYAEIKKIASKEGIKCFTGSDNVGFEYYIKG